MSSLYFPVIGGTLGSPYGSRTDPFTGKVKQHRGLDIKAPQGSGVIAPTDITITQAGWNKGGYGNLIVGTDGQNEYYFAHLNSIGVRPGDTVAGGQQIGTVGSTGRSTGPHLHFGVKDAQGNWLNPASLLDKGKGLLDKGKKVIEDFTRWGTTDIPGTEGIRGFRNDMADCGLDPFCWISKVDFFVRFAMVVLALALIVGALYMFGSNQVKKTITQAVRG
jgi:hypothetical protein